MRRHPPGVGGRARISEVGRSRPTMPARQGEGCRSTDTRQPEEGEDAGPPRGYSARQFQPRRVLPGDRPEPIRGGHKPRLGLAIERAPSIIGVGCRHEVVTCRASDRWSSGPLNHRLRHDTTFFRTEQFMVGEWVETVPFRRSARGRMAGEPTSTPRRWSSAPDRFRLYGKPSSNSVDRCRRKPRVFRGRHVVQKTIDYCTSRR